MPFLKGVTVHILRKGDQGRAKSEVPEWGRQTFSRLNVVSCYIQSESNMQFEISVQPDLGHFRALNKTKASSSSRISDKYDANSPFGYHLLATVYLDGRQRPERRVIVYLNPEHREYAKPDGKVYCKTRWAQGEDGELYEYGWYFKDVGLETLFDRILISKGEQSTEPMKSAVEEALLQTMQSATLDPESDREREENLRVGQIIIEIQRVVLGAQVREINYRANHKQGEQDSTEGAGGGVVMHTTGLCYEKRISSTVPVVAYTPYQRGEPAYARFQFFYRSENTLAKFNFDGFSLKRPLRNRANRPKPLFDTIMGKRSLNSPFSSLPSDFKNSGQGNKDHSKSTSEFSAQDPIFNFGDDYGDSYKKMKTSGDTTACVVTFDSNTNPKTLIPTIRRPSSPTPDTNDYNSSASTFIPDNAVVSLIKSRRPKTSTKCLARGDGLASMAHSSADEADDLGLKHIRGQKDPGIYRQAPVESDADDEHETPSDDEVDMETDDQGDGTTGLRDNDGLRPNLARLALSKVPKLGKRRRTCPDEGGESDDNAPAEKENELCASPAKVSCTVGL